jgi:pimeloyl-ACP methyl ester carboxylesterase
MRAGERTGGRNRARRTPTLGPPIVTEFVVVLALIAAACGTDSVDADEARRSSSTPPTRPTVESGDPPTRAAPVAFSIEWDACDDDDDHECGTLVVPRDHADPDNGATVTIALRRRPADERDERIGAILMNPGGPGAAGQDLVASLEESFPRSILDRFDLVGWDPRGTGESTRVTCEPDLEAFFALDKSPDDRREEAANVAAARAFAAACAESDGDLLPFLGTTQTVEDIDAIRAALGDDALTYLGFSYGTYLGARYAETHSDRLRALVLDGPVDPSVSAEASIEQQSLGFERALGAFLDWCDATDCGFGGSDPAVAFDRLAAAVDAEPVFAEIAGEERVLGPGEFDLGVAMALYFGENGYDGLADALSDAAGGDGSRLLELADLYAGRVDDGDYDGSMTAFYSIGCVDSPRFTLAEIRRLAGRLARRAPALGPANAWLGLPCVYWDAPADPGGAPHRIEVPSDAPILVTATDGDPATPIEWARGLAEQLGVPLLVAESDQHTAFLAGDDCIDDAIIDFLADPTDAVSRC